MILQTLLHPQNKRINVNKMVKSENLRGKKVFAANGMEIGELDDVEIDENTWAIKTLYVILRDDVAKLYGIKTGFRKEAIVPIPASYVGPLMGENINLKEEIKDVNTLREKIEMTP